MLKIRAEQMAVLEAYMTRQFENKMIVHLRKNFPNETQESSENELRSFTQVGIRQAKGYGVELEKDIQGYLEMMMIYGIDFDANPKTAWAGEILRTKDIDGTTKMNRLDDYELNLLRKEK